MLRSFAGAQERNVFCFARALLRLSAESVNLRWLLRKANLFAFLNGGAAGVENLNHHFMKQMPLREHCEKPSRP